MKPKSFGEWVVMERDKRGLSQGELEERTGIGHSHMSKIENGHVRNPSHATRRRFHEVFGTSDDDLVDIGLLEKRPRVGGGVIYEPTKATASVATEAGEAITVVSLIEQLPDEAVHHLRRFLESITESR